MKRPHALECPLMKTLTLCLTAWLATAATALAQEPAQEPADSPEIDWSRVNVDALSLLREMPQSSQAPRLTGPGDVVLAPGGEQRCSP